MKRFIMSLFLLTLTVFSVNMFANEVVKQTHSQQVPCEQIISVNVTDAQVIVAPQVNVVLLEYSMPNLLVFERDVIYAKNGFYEFKTPLYYISNSWGNYNFRATNINSDMQHYKQRNLIC